MNQIFVLSSTQKPLMPCQPARARQLLRSKKAAIYRMQPFTIILKDRADGDVQGVEFKVDPGSKTSGLALVGHFEQQGAVALWGANLNHRGHAIRDALESRRSLRRGRRGRKTRYRQARFFNRTRLAGWLPPSLASRINNILSILRKLITRCPITEASQELVKFDLQKSQNPEISGVEYQQGELAGYEVREYLLEKWHRTCAYCGKKDVPLQVEHIQPRAHGGSNRVPNLTLACQPCNQKKGSQPVEIFLKKKPAILKRINQVVHTDKYGFPRGKAGRIKRVFGFSTGDRVKLIQPKGKYAGTHTGRLAGIRATGMLDIQVCVGTITASWKNFRLVQRHDGYDYAT